MIALASNRIIELAVVEVLPTTHPIACNGWHSEPTYRHKSIGVHVQIDYCSFAYSALACFSIGMSGSASFHSVRKSLEASHAFAVSPASV